LHVSVMFCHILTHIHLNTRTIRFCTAAGLHVLYETPLVESTSINNLVSKLGIMVDVVGFSVLLTAGKSKFLFLIINATSVSKVVHASFFSGGTPPFLFFFEKNNTS
jgi:hypothetical protein